MDTLLRAASPDLPFVWFDTGNFSADATEDGRVQTAAIVETMGRLRVAVANVAEQEVRAGLDALVERGRAAGVPLVSASLVAADGGPPPFPGHVVLEVGGRRILGAVFGARRVAVIGLMRHLASVEGVSAGRRVVTRPPAEALRAELAAVRSEGADDIIVLAALTQEEARQLVDAQPGVDLVLGGLGGAVEAVRDGSTLLACSGVRGQTVGELRVGAREGGRLDLSDRFHLLDRRFPSDAATLEAQTGVNRRINERNRAVAERLALERAKAGPGPSAAASAPTHAGTAACRGCHPAEHLAWERTSHAHALQSLVAAEADFNPTCLQCHVTGWAKPGGFRSRLETPGLAGVQCEACHGPGAAHAAGGGVPGPTEASLAACAACHDEANSPGFRVEDAWQRITHGQDHGPGLGRPNLDGKHPGP